MKLFFYTILFISLTQSMAQTNLDWLKKYMTEADKAYDAEDYDTALLYLDSAGHQNSKHKEIYILRTKIGLKTDKSTTSLIQDMENWQTKYEVDLSDYIVKLYLDAEYYEKADEILTKKLETNPNDIGLLESQATSYLKRKQFESALPFIDRILTITDGDNVTAINNKGVILTKRGEYEEAEKYFLYALDLDGNNSLAKYNLGLTLFDLNKDKDQACLLMKESENAPINSVYKQTAHDVFIKHCQNVLYQ